MGDRENNVFMAKLAEQAERYDDMVNYMTDVAKSGEELSVEERNLLSVAYKNVIGARRASLRTLAYLEQREEGEKEKKSISDYHAKIETELNDVCNKILGIIDEFLLANTKQGDSKVFYLTLKGDYYRYLAEFFKDEKKTEVSENSLKAYQAASEIAEAELPPTHPIRLSLSLNFSVCYYEIINKPDEARALAKKAFDEAIAKLDDLTEDSYKDSTLIMQLLRDNLTLWSSEGEDDEDSSSDDDDDDDDDGEN